MVEHPHNMVRSQKPLSLPGGREVRIGVSVDFYIGYRNCNYKVSKSKFNPDYDLCFYVLFLVALRDS